MARKLDIQGKILFMEAVTLDTETTYDSLYLGEGGAVEIIPLNNSAAVVVDLDKGWHPIAFKQVNTASTTVTGSKIFGCLNAKDV